MILEITQIVLLFIVPVLLVYYKIIPFKYRKHTLIAVSLIMIAIILLEKWTLKQLGIRLDNIQTYAIPYAVITIVGILFLLTMSRLLKRKPERSITKKKHLIYGFILVSILQELLFRGFLFPKLESIFAEQIVIIILVNALLFTLIHSIYSNDTISLVMIFISGICFAGMYWIYPNLILIIISHAILNYIAVLHNFYYEEKMNVKIIGN